MSYIGYISPYNSQPALLEEVPLVLGIASQFDEFAIEVSAFIASFVPVSYPSGMTRDPVDPVTGMVQSVFIYDAKRPNAAVLSAQSAIRKGAYDMFAKFSDDMIRKYVPAQPTSYLPSLVETDALGQSMRDLRAAAEFLIYACEFRASGVDPTGWHHSLMCGTKLTEAKTMFIDAALARYRSLHDSLFVIV